MITHRHSHRPLVRAALALCGVVTACCVVSGGAAAAEPQFVGVLALAVEDDVARQLELSEDQKTALLKLIDARENLALELALALKNYPSSEREKKLAPFRRESEQKGLELLRPEQRAKLERIRIQRSGLATLAEPPIAERLNLTEQQRAKVAELLHSRNERLAKADRDSAHVVRAEVERALAEVLNEEQRAAWQMLAFGPPRPVPSPSAQPPAPVPPPGQEPVVGQAAQSPDPADVATSATPQTAEAPAPEPAETQPGATPETGPAQVSPAEAADASLAEPAGPSEAQSMRPVEAQVAQPSPAQSASPSDSEPAQPPEAELAPPAEPSETEPAQPSEMTDEELLQLLESELEDTPPEGPARIRFSFRYQPWEDVLDWFARQAGLSLHYETLPQGTCNYDDPREHSVAEAIDLLNRLLLIKGYVLIRSERMLILANLEDLEDGMPPGLVTIVPVEQLDERGEYDLVTTVFQLETITSEEAKAEIEALIGRPGSIVALPKAQQIVVTGTAGRLRTIRDAIRRIEDPEGLTTQRLQCFPLDFALAEEVLAILRQMFGIPADENAAADGSIRFALDPMGMRLIAFGKQSKLEQVAKVLEALQSPDMENLQTEAIEGALQLEVYPVAPADPQSALKVMQTLLAGSPGARLSIDEKTGNLIALARPEDQATVRATLDQIRRQAIRVAVFQLRAMDPQLAVLSITKLFGGGEGSTFKVDADPTTRRLYVRGTETEIEQIRTWLEQVGESGTAEATDTAASGNVRLLPLSGWSANSALELLQQIWPTMHGNKIRVITPSAPIPALRAGQPEATSQSEESLLERLYFGPQPAIQAPPAGQLTPRRPILLPPDTAPSLEPSQEPAVQEPQTLSPNEPAPDEAAQPEAKSAFTPKMAFGPRIIFASEAISAGPESPQATPEQPPSAEEPSRPPENSPEIIVTVGPGGIMIASDDVEALNDFEHLLTALASGAMTGTSDLTVFYLVHSTATVAAETLDQIFGGGTLATGRDSGGGSVLNDLAGAAFGDAGTLVGSLLGLGGDGGTIAPSGSIQIIPDSRLNALIVRANPTDTQTIKQVLEIIDQKASPEEILAQAKARPIPLQYTQAEEMAEIVSTVYQDRMSTSSRGRQPSPQEFLEALRGRGRGGSRRSSAEDSQKMSVGVDVRTNSLIVYAPLALFEEVKEFVEGLDQAAIGASNQAIRVVTLKRANAESVQKALQTLVGESVQTGSSRSSSSDRRRSYYGGGSPMDDMRRMMIMRAMQGGGGPPGFGGPPGLGSRGFSRGDFGSRGFSRGGGPSRGDSSGGGPSRGGGGPR